MVVLAAGMVSGCWPKVRPRGLPHQVWLPIVVSGYPGKKGVGLTYNYCEDVSAVGAVYAYNWGFRAPACAGSENIPMVWGEQEVVRLMRGEKPGGNSQWVLGFNEPDLCPSQACMSPLVAAIEWRQVELALPDRLLVAPAPSDLHPEWLPQFRDEFHNRYGRWPRLDGLAVHCYRRAAADCIALVEQYVAWGEEWGAREVWVTEFAFPPCRYATEDGAQVEARRLITWLEASPVTRYFWWSNRQMGAPFEQGPGNPGCWTGLVDQWGGLTTLGEMYRRAGSQ